MLKGLKGYAEIISSATGVTDRDIIEDIEDTMRHEVFHSTLDWQTREQLIDGAREAYEIVKECRNEYEAEQDLV